MAGHARQTTEELYHIIIYTVRMFLPTDLIFVADKSAKLSVIIKTPNAGPPLLSGTTFHSISLCSAPCGSPLLSVVKISHHLSVYLDTFQHINTLTDDCHFARPRWLVV